MTEQNEAKQLETVVAAAEAVIKADAKPLSKPEDYRKRVKKMTNRQLCGELKSIARNKEVTPLAGALAVILLRVMNGTSETNPKARLGAYPR